MRKVFFLSLLFIINSMASGVCLAAAEANLVAKDCPSDRLCSGDRVFDTSENSRGNILEVYDNSKALIKYNYGKVSVVDINNLGKGLNCFKNVCVGDRVVDVWNQTGSILELFDNGIAYVSYDGYAPYHIRINKLSKGL